MDALMLGLNMSMQALSTTIPDRVEDSPEPEILSLKPLLPKLQSQSCRSSSEKLLPVMLHGSPNPNQAKGTRSRLFNDVYIRLDSARKFRKYGKTWCGREVHSRLKGRVFGWDKVARLCRGMMGRL